ncbi:MAG: carbohydrate binding family 9 domain-containing protein, partial [Armatimonadota bacterium]
ASWILVATAALTLLPPAVAAEGAGEPEAAPPSIPAVKVTEPPLIDGLLDDACWQQATHIEGFWRQTVDAPEIERTEAWLCYDGRAIYAAFRCHDSRPSQIRCDQKKRQGTLWRDDCVELGLDVESTGHIEYAFQVNPAGTQRDEVPGGTSEKIEWKGDWRAAARVDDAGWSAEMEIPFSILRYPDGQDCFRFWVRRRLAREEDESCWPPGFARRSDTEERARWSGILTPPLPFRYVVMPYALSVASEYEEERETLTGGLDFKGTFPNGLVALATYNPDFRNIEDVVETIDFTYVERYLPEYRPFFQEGEWHMPSEQIFYSRRVEELDVGAKVFGTLGSHSLGLLDTYARGGENHLACNYEHLFGTKGAASFSAVDRRVPGEPHNVAYGLFARRDWMFTGAGRYLYAWRPWTRTEGEGGDDSAVSVGTGFWQNEGLGWNLGYSAVGSEFDARDGYVPETGVRNASVGLHHRLRYDESALQERYWRAESRTGESEAGRRASMLLEHARHWRTGWSAWFGTIHGERDGFDVATNFTGVEWNRLDIYHRGQIDVDWGERYGEPYYYQSLVQTFHPIQRCSAELRAERVYAADLDDDRNVIPPEWSRQVVLTTTYDVTQEKTVSARLVRRGSNSNVYAAYRQRVRKGMDLLIVAGDPNADEWVSRLAVKAIWCF